MTGKEIVKRWESSPGHLAQMRCPTAGIGAIGVVYQDGIYWYALVYTFQGTNVG